MDFRLLDLGVIPTLAGRVSFAGDLGYEFWVRPEFHARLWDDILGKGEDLGIRPFGSRAMRSMSLEKGFGSWATEYRPIYGPFAAGMGRFVSLNKRDFIGRESAVLEKEQGPEKTLVTFTVDVADCDVMGNEPVYQDGEIVGYVTSGMYAHYVDQSVALGYVPTGLANNTGGGAFSIEIMGDMRPATIVPKALFDPDSSRMRG